MINYLRLSFGGTCSGTCCKTILSQGKSRIFGCRVIVSQIERLNWTNWGSGDHHHSLHVCIKSLHPITNWSQYIKFLIHCGSLAFWVDADAMENGSTPTITGDGDVASFHWPDHLYLLDSQGDFQPLPASDPRATRLSDLVDECFLCAPPITAVPASEPVRWRCL